MMQKVCEETNNSFQSVSFTAEEICLESRKAYANGSGTVEYKEGTYKDVRNGCVEGSGTIWGDTRDIMIMENS